jgi:quercetin dioxygenase-like cupin family protein
MSQEPFHHRIFENDFVAVYDVVLPVGETMKFHAHPTEHLALVLEGGLLKNEVMSLAPKESPTGEAGAIIHIAAGPPHRQTNTGKAPVRFTAIELLKSPHPQTGSAPATGVEQRVAPSQAEGCVVAVEGATVRVWRCRVNPGNVSPARGEGGPFLRVAIVKGSVAQPIAGVKIGPVVELEAGHASWYDDASSTAVKNLGTRPFEFVDIGWK